MSTLKVNSIIDASGGNTATINTYTPPAPVRAWVNFNGTGTVSIRAQYNVSSITDNGIGNYTANFTTAMPDANYAVCFTTGSSVPTTSYGTGLSAAPTTTSINLRSGDFATYADVTYASVAIFR